MPWKGRGDECLAGKSRRPKGPQEGKCFPLVRGLLLLGSQGRNPTRMESNPCKRQQDEGPQLHLWDSPPAQRTCRREGAGDKPLVAELKTSSGGTDSRVRAASTGCPRCTGGLQGMASPGPQKGCVTEAAYTIAGPGHRAEGGHFCPGRQLGHPCPGLTSAPRPQPF